MKLLNYANGSQSSLGLVKDNGVIDLRRHIPAVPSGMIALIEDWDAFQTSIGEVDRYASPDLYLADLQLLAPIQRPGKIMAIGLNYKDHIEESKMPVPQHQTWFAKATTAINAPYASIHLPRVSSQLDYEAELVAVIGKRCRHISRELARDAVFGYCAGNDVSVRDWQLQTPQWTLGKSFDTHSPIGPWIVTAEEIGDPHELGIRSRVNGELRQNSNTRHLLFDVCDQIAHLSKAMTLEPGDLIFTGTPGGVGLAHNPPSWLKAGDVVQVEIDRIGFIEGTIIEEPSE